MTQATRKRRRRQHAHPIRRIVFTGLALGTGSVVAALVVFALWVVHTANSAPNLTDLQARVPGSTSQIFASNGQLLGNIASDVLRTPLKQAQQPTLLRDATVAIEDRRFFQHGGVDYEGLLRAAVKDVVKGGGIQGGSTLTMQLVTNIYLPSSLSQSHNLKYKIVQAKLATELEDKHSKNWILTQYLNDVPYGTMGGQTAIGVGAASQMLFDKPVKDLDLAQVALLAGLPQAPSEYNPFEDPSLARWRRGLVLQAMATAGYISQAQARATQRQPLQVARNTSIQDVDQPYVVDYVEQQLVQDLGARVVDRGGLKVYTTINLADQAAAAQAIKENEGRPGDPAASLVSVDPSNGQIVALANSTTYGTGKGQTVFDYATQAARQPGSSFKAFVLMTLIHDQDGDPNDTYYNSAPLPAGWLPSYPTYAVHNAEAGSLGDISVTRATALSVNAVYVQLGVDLGMKNVDATAHAMGITSPLYGYPAEAIGGLTKGVSALQMADSYATLANGGSHVPTTIIARVVLPSGKTVDLGDPAKTRVFSEGEAYAGTQTLQTVLQYGTGTGASYGCPAAGKTGTTSDYTDAWFVGYTPKLSTAVWVGYPDDDVSMTDINGLGPGYGGTLAAPIWRDFMQSASDGYCGSFPEPNSYWHGVEYFGKHASSVYQAPSPNYYTAPVTTATTTPTTTTTGATTVPNGDVQAVTTPSSQSGIPQSTATTPQVPTPPPASSGGSGGF